MMKVNCMCCMDRMLNSRTSRVYRSALSYLHSCQNPVREGKKPYIYHGSSGSENGFRAFFISKNR